MSGSQEWNIERMTWTAYEKNLDGVREDSDRSNRFGREQVQKAFAFEIRTRSRRERSVNAQEDRLKCKDAGLRVSSANLKTHVDCAGIINGRLLPIAWTISHFGRQIPAKDLAMSTEPAKPSDAQRNELTF